MYRYDEFDHAFVHSRTEQFRDQVRRRLSGELTEDEFKPLRLMNGVYLQLHAYMLRVAIPYGTLSGGQMRMLAEIARDYDRGVDAPDRGLLWLCARWLWRFFDACFLCALRGLRISCGSTCSSPRSSGDSVSKQLVTSKMPKHDML